jgi:hypothetical protein
MAFDTVWTRYAENRIHLAVFQATPIPVAAADWRIGLMLGKAGYDATKVVGRDDVVEVSSATNPSYARQPLGATTTTNPANAPPTVSNAAEFSYPEAQEAWGEIVALGLFDAAGNLWAVSPSAVADRRTVRAGDRMTVPVGQFQLTGYQPPAA